MLINSSFGMISGMFEFIGNSLVLTFKSDASTTRNGFNIKLVQVPCSNTYQASTRRPLSGCENNFYSNAGSFRSESHPQDYGNNYECKFQFQNADGHCAVELTFEEFLLEESEECANDYVNINGLLFCGQQLQGHKSKWQRLIISFLGVNMDINMFFFLLEIIPFTELSEVSFTFATDASRTSSGFKGRYKLLPCQHKAS